MRSSQPLDQDPMAGQTLKVNITRAIIWLIWFSQRPVDIWQVNGLIGSTRIQIFGSYNLLHQSLPRGTVMAIDHERLRFSQNCQLSHALISIVISFYHPISTRSTGKVNSFYSSLFLSRSWLILRFLDLRNPNLTFVYLFGALYYVKLIFYLINT